MPRPASAPPKPSPPLAAGDPAAEDAVPSSSGSPCGASPSSPVYSWDSRELRKHAENLELEESKRISFDPTLLSTLEGLLLHVYGMLRPKTTDYEQRMLMVEVFNKMATEIFGNKNAPAVEAFGSFTMDLFTAQSDLDLSVNFNGKDVGDCARQEKKSVIRKFAKVLYSHQSKGRVRGVLPVLTARVPVLKVTDQGTGIECDLSVENQDGITRSLIFKLISSIDERFRILSYLMKSWAKAHDINSPKDGTMSSMSIISLVAFHLQTRRPPILPAFSAVLKDSSDFASIQKNIFLFKQFGSRNKESVAELFISLMSKLSSVDNLWRQGLCASNYEGFWISKSWSRRGRNLNVEDFLDRSENFARSVGEGEMYKICECFRVSASNLLGFMSGEINASKLKELLFGPLCVDHLVIAPRVKHGHRKRKTEPEPERRPEPNKRAKNTVYPIQQNHIPQGASYTASANSPNLFRPVLCQTTPIRSNLQFMHMPQNPSGFSYGLPLNSPGTAHISSGIFGQPHNSVVSNQIRQRQQDPNLFVPLSGQRPLFQSYSGTRLLYDQNAVHSMPYGIHREFRR